MPSKDYLLVGVTGGIGSGKTLVCSHFRGLGREVISADGIARALTETDDRVRAKIRRVFGEGMFMPDGALDRKKMASVVFADPAARKKLDAIVHPAVFSAIERLLQELPAQRRMPYVVVEAALVFETGMEDRLDIVVAVQAPEEMRIMRVMERDGCPRTEVLARIKSQMPAGRKTLKADFVVDNGENATALPDKVRFIDCILQKMLSPSA